MTGSIRQTELSSTGAASPLSQNGRQLSGATSRAGTAVRRAIRWASALTVLASSLGALADVARASCGTNLVMVTGDGAFGSGDDAAKKALFESWGYTVTAIDDSAPQATYDAAATGNDVMFLSDTAAAGAGTKARGLDIGIVSEHVQGTWRDLMYSGSQSTSGPTTTTVNVIDNSHFITTPFSTGGLTIYSPSTMANFWATTLPPGAQVLAEQSGDPSRKFLIAFEMDAELFSSNYAVDRRVLIGTQNSDFTRWSNDLKTLVERSLSFVSCRLPANLRSIGTRPDYGTSEPEGNGTTVTATDGSTIVTGSGTQWRTANRGRGDRINIDGANYTVAWVDSETELRLTTAFTGTDGPGLDYAIYRQFTTIADWENCIDGSGNGGTCAPFPEVTADLVADNRREVGIAYKDSVFTGTFRFNGTTTDAGHDITLTVDPGNRHAGIAWDGVGSPTHVVVDIAVASDVLRIRDEYVTVEWLEITGGNFGVDIANQSGNNRVILRQNLIHDCGRAGVYIHNSPDAVLDIYNNLVYDNPEDGIWFPDLSGPWGAGAAVRIVNNTIYNNVDWGIGSNLATNAEVYLRNNLTFGNVQGDIIMPGADSDYNVDSDGTDSGANSHQNVPLTGAGGVNFVSTGGIIDLHLLPTSVALNQGDDVSSVSSVDIDDESRPKGASWDIGADEAVASGSCPTTNPAWYDTDWQYRNAIALNSTLVAGPLADFPVLVVMDDDTGLAADAEDTNFNDVLFTSADGVTKLSHEIEAFDSVQGDLTAWVKVPYVSSGSDTIIYIYYGNGSAADQRDAVNVWDSNYEAVWHLSETVTDEGTSGTHADSTSNGNDGAQDGNDDTTGQIALGQDFDGTDYVNVPFFADPNDGPYTWSAWFKPTALPDYHVFVSQADGAGTGRSVLQILSGGNELDTHIGGGGLAGTTTLTVGDWYHTSVSWSSGGSGTTRLYLNGTEEATLTIDPESATGDHLIGRSKWASNWFIGLLDEMRVSQIARSAEWIETSYNNQFDPIADPAGFCLVCSATTTEVKLVSFEAAGLDGSVELRWETASELRNLGFHVYRSSSELGPYERITAQVLPGLGSSPVGAEYSYRDTGLVNGVTYYYELEDIETTGRTEMHGPVSATPQAGTTADPPNESGESSSRITYGDPSSNTFRVLERGRTQVVLVLDINGFYAVPQDDETVAIEIPDLDVFASEDALSIPVKRTWVEAIVGRKVELVSVRALDEETIEGLTPAGESPEIVATRRGAVRAHRQRKPRTANKLRGIYPEESARVLDVGYQGDAKKALVELAPLRWDPAVRRLRLARRLEVTLAFRGRDLSDPFADGGRGRRFRRTSSRRKRGVVARLSTREKGLYAIRFEDVLARRHRGISSNQLRLSRQGETVAYHLDPPNGVFGRGSMLYFVGEGAKANPYGLEAVYELEVGASGETMEVIAADPTGEAAAYYWKELSQEENRLYLAGLTQAPDLWLWEMVMSPAEKSYDFEVDHLASSAEPSRLKVWLQGASNFPVAPDHHVRLTVNGVLVDEVSWDGNQSQVMETELLSGVLQEGENRLELENVGDTPADYSMVVLNRFEVLYPRFPVAVYGKLEGTWGESGVAQIAGLSPVASALDVTDESPRWLTETEVTSNGTFRFRTEVGRSYLAVDRQAVLLPEIEKVARTNLDSPHKGADYIVIGPRELLTAANPLLERRRSQGLRVQAVATETITSAFGFGEKTPGAIRDFLAYAYHQWREPSPRYVLLLGDATYDFKDYLKTGSVNQVPPLMVKTSYLWTASDPAYASVNGEDLLPDLAIGRLPAASADELRTMVHKIIAYETGTANLEAPVVLIADDPDGAGNFESNAAELASSVLSSNNSKTIYLSQLGADTTRVEILSAFDEGASLMSYIGHGGIHLWADETVFHTDDTAYLSIQSQQPLLLTMNCLNGYFHFPYFDSLAEKLVKADGKGAIAAFSPSGLSLNEPAHRYHTALLREIFDGRHERLGDAVLAAQEAYVSTGAMTELLVIYHLFGDPALIVR